MTAIGSRSPVPSPARRGVRPEMMEPAKRRSYQTPSAYHTKRSPSMDLLAQRCSAVEVAIAAGLLNEAIGRRMDSFYSADPQSGDTMHQSCLAAALQKIIDDPSVPQEKRFSLTIEGHSWQGTLADAMYDLASAKVHETVHLAQFGKSKFATRLFPLQTRMGSILQSRFLALPNEAKFTRAIEMVYERFRWELDAYRIAGCPKSKLGNHIFGSCEFYINMISQVFPEECKRIGFEKDNWFVFYSFMKWWGKLTTVECLVAAGEGEHVAKLAEDKCC